MRTRFLMILAAGLLWTGLALARVDLNSAGVEELDGLKGIGPAKAQAIVDYRRQHGPFKSVSDLRQVPGIGESTLQGLRRDVTVNPAAATANKIAFTTQMNPALI